MSQFADIKTPYINGVTLKRILVPEVKENIFQGIITRPNEAVTEKFSNDTDAAELQIIRVKPNAAEAREIGADVNGGYFNGNDATQPSTQAYSIKILDTYDAMTDIPTNMQNMVNVDLAAAELKNIAGKVNKNINAATLAAQISACLNACYDDSDTTHIKKLGENPTASDYKDLLFDASAVLDNGNEDEGIDAYPTDERAYIIRPEFKNYLLKSGALIVGGSNDAQTIIKLGGLDKDTKADIINGFVGHVDNVPVYVAANPIWNKVAGYLGLNKSALAHVMGVLAAACGTGRALAFNAEMKMIDAPNGQGIRLQPKYRWGVDCFDGKSVVVLADYSFSNPVVSSATKLETKAVGSRMSTLKYNANGGTGTIADVSKLYGTSVTLSDGTGLTPPQSKTFSGWALSAEGDKVYDAGAAYKLEGDVTLYAVWG